jgi:hypothetical protein
MAISDEDAEKFGEVDLSKISSGKPTRNSRVLASFVVYCQANPELRFWQALRNWSKYAFIYASNSTEAMHKGLVEDTFYWEGMTRDDKTSH